MPYFSAIGRILLIYVNGFLNSCSFGTKIGASPGTSNSNSSFFMMENELCDWRADCMWGRDDDDDADTDVADDCWVVDDVLGSVSSDVIVIASFLLRLLSKSMVSMGSILVDLFDSMLLICILNVNVVSVNCFVVSNDLSQYV